MGSHFYCLMVTAQFTSYFKTPSVQQRILLYASQSKSSPCFHAQKNSTILQIGEMAKALLCW